MKISSRRLTILITLFVIPWILLSHLPSAHAIDPVKIVLPAVSDRSGYNLPELNAALQNKLRSQFRFPKYETLLTPAMSMAPDRPALERMTLENSADGAVAVEISFLRNQTLYGGLNDEIYEETDITLILTYFDKKTGQYGQFKTSRHARELMSVYSGALPLAVEALEELLNRIDKVFPRQFPGSRY
jgi:hypothetical protein